VDFACLVPALVVTRGNPKGIAGLSDLARADVRAAIAEPRTVCVGEYAVDILERAGLADGVLERVGRTRSCAALADLAALGSVDAIVGWGVFARWYPEQLEAVALPAELVTRVATISGAVTTVARDPAAARRVLAWLAGPEGRELWREAGYLVNLDEVRALAPNATVGR
jgi:molybdate transport system substrate-binding protein